MTRPFVALIPAGVHPLIHRLAELLGEGVSKPLAMRRLRPELRALSEEEYLALFHQSRDLRRAWLVQPETDNEQRIFDSVAVTDCLRYDYLDAANDRALAWNRRQLVQDRISRGTRLDEYLLALPDLSARARIADLHLLRVSTCKPVRLSIRVWNPAFAKAGSRTIRTVRALARAYAGGEDLYLTLDYLASGFRWQAFHQQGLPGMPYKVEDLFADLEVLNPEVRR